LALDIIKFGHF